MTLQFTRRSLLLVFFGLAPVHLLPFPRQLRIIDHWFGLSEKRFFFVTTRTFVSWSPCISGTLTVTLTFIPIAPVVFQESSCQTPSEKVNIPHSVVVAMTRRVSYLNSNWTLFSSSWSCLFLLFLRTCRALSLVLAQTLPSLLLTERQSTVSKYILLSFPSSFNEGLLS